ncbi:hypothetical protein BaRGS_00004300, partial [Batillaria attramentaria]
MGLAWKRPKQIRSNPQLYTQGRSLYDVGQGSAGTCWFLATLSTIADKKVLMDKVIPPNSYKLGTPAYDGKFHARFWQFGKWEDVFVDDFLPVVYNDVIWGARNKVDENEMWVSLIEKAFAKYHGSYNAASGGHPGDSYMNLTGGVSENIEHKEVKDNDEFYARIKNAINSGSQVISSVPGKFEGVQGLLGNHAYSMSGTATVKGEKLLRLRNPWGDGTEWKGRWSDGHYNWRGVSPNEVPHADKDDGEFWISFNDFLELFNETTICSLTPDFDRDGRTDRLDYALNIYGQWIGPSAAGFENKLRNPKYGFTVPDKGEDIPVVVQLIQKKQHRKDQTDQIRCDLFKVQGSDGKRAVLENMGENTNSYTNAAQRSFRFRLKGGNYCLVPSAADAGTEREFLIRVFSPVPLTNVRDIGGGLTLLSCELQNSLTYRGRDYPLKFSRVEFGAWKNGENAGGHIGHNKSHDINPQYQITITEYEIPVMFRVLQARDQRPMPIGLWLYSLDPGENIPVTYDQIYEKHKGAVSKVLETIDGEDNKYIRGYDFDATYMLRRGEYLLLVHTDSPGRGGDFTLLIKSSGDVGI